MNDEDVRAEIAGILRSVLLTRVADDMAARIVALPVLQRLVEQAAEAERLRATVERGREAIRQHRNLIGSAVAQGLRRALDGTDG